MVVNFTIQVDSVNGSDGEAVLMRKDASSGEYAQIDDQGAVIAYTGDWTGDWTVPNETQDYGLSAKLPFAEGHHGSIEHLQVRFNYTDADGESAYIDSDEITVCRGTYVSFRESLLGGSGFAAYFDLDTEILPDPSKITCSATIEINGRTVELSTSISDGVLSVGGLFEEILEAGETINTMGPVKVTLNYNDGDADWTVEAEGEIDRSPQISIDQVLVGSTLNGPGGLRSTLIEYSVYGNGALVSGHSVKLIQGDYSKSWDNEEEGDFTINDSIVLDGDDGYLYYPSTGMSVEVTVWYSLDQGETWEEKTETTTDIQECDCGLEVEIDSSYHSSDGIEVNGTVTLDSSILNKSDDPCGYSAVISGARIEWLPADPEATPNAVDFEYTDSSISLDDPLSRGVSREFSVWGSPPPSSATGYRLYVDADNASGTMGGKTYTYVGTLTGTATFDFPEPATLSVTVDGGKGTNEGGLLSASGTATIGYDPSTDATGGELQSFFINWYGSSGTEPIDSTYFVDGEAGVSISSSLTSSSSGQFVYAYSFSGVSVPSNAYGFTVEIYGAVLKDSKQIDWPYGESAKADILLANLFTLDFFDYDEEQGLHGYFDLTSPALAGDLEGLVFTRFKEDAVDGTYSDDDYFLHYDDSGFVGMEDTDFEPVKPNTYYIQVKATYLGHEYSSEKVRINIEYPTLESSSDATFIESHPNYVEGNNTFTITAEIEVWVDPDYTMSPTLSMTASDVVLVWDSDAQPQPATITVTGPNDEGDGYYLFTVSTSAVEVPDEAKEVKLSCNVQVAYGDETATIKVSDEPMYTFP